MDDIIIKADKLTKEYDAGFEKVRALDGVSFEARRGEFIAVTGASGSGKSTLLHILGGVEASAATVIAHDTYALPSVVKINRAFSFFIHTTETKEDTGKNVVLFEGMIVK